MSKNQQRSAYGNSRGSSAKVGSSRMHLDYLLNEAKDIERAGSVAGRSGSETPKSVMCGSLMDVNYLTKNSGKRPERHNNMDKHETDNKGASSGASKERKFKCELCESAFGMKSNLKRHVMTVHEDRRGHQCEICGAAFGLKQNLETHVRVKHEKKKPFQCPICGASFGYKQVLQNHRRNIHGLE